jgi:hypothetical protein
MLKLIENMILRHKAKKLGFSEKSFCYERYLNLEEWVAKIRNFDPVMKAKYPFIIGTSHYGEKDDEKARRQAYLAIMENIGAIAKSYPESKSDLRKIALRAI